MAFMTPMSEEEVFKSDDNDDEFNSINSFKIGIHDASTDRSFLFMDENEDLHIATPEIFFKRLRCSDKNKIKVVSIFGNTGDGKSHTMNHTFFNGEEVFKTSPEQNSCTLGVYASMQHKMGVLCLDTEGMLGMSSNSNRHMRMLLKILAISDIVIYRTRADRLHKDMYVFLGTASNAFNKHFAQALQSLSIPGTAKTMGPAVLIFHETRHTKPLESSIEESAEDYLREGFSKLNLNINAFSSLRYIGVQTKGSDAATDFSKLHAAVLSEIKNTAVRSPRQPSVIFKAMRALNQKFSGEIIEKNFNPFPEQYFTCTVHCESCTRRCQRSMGHALDGENHLNKHPCNYQHKYENKVYLCRNCYNNGREVIVTITTQGQQESAWYSLAKYVWSGAVIECPHCGEIYRARQYWYGNESPETTAVRSEVVHVWQGGNITAKAPVHSARLVLDGVSSLSEVITSVSATPLKAVSGWLADSVAPAYWRPNIEITNCFACKKNFEQTGLPKHHCRGCGEGFCHACSQQRIPVPSRGWMEAVRVCNDCHSRLVRVPEAMPEHATESFIQTQNHTNDNESNTNNAGPANDEADILVRKYGETLYNTVTSLAAAAYEIPKEMIKDSARPTYWVPDADAPVCHICKILFGTAEELEVAKTNGKLEQIQRTAEIQADPQETANAQAQYKRLLALNRTGDCWRHHCRSCGQAVCDACSQKRRPVPERGWTTNVRVCDACACMTNSLGDNKSKQE